MSAERVESGRGCAASFAVALFCFYAATGAGHSSFGDGYVLMLTARSLLEHGTLAMDPVPLAGSAQRIGPDGRRYAEFAPGLAIAHVPALLAARTWPSSVPGGGGQTDVLLRDEFWSQLTNAWLMALTVTVIAVAGRRLGFSNRASYGVAGLMAVASPLWLYARIDSTEALQGLGLSAAFFFVVPSAAGRRSSAAAAGLSLVIAVVAKVANFCVVPWFLLYVAASTPRGRRLSSSLAMLAPVAATAVVLAALGAWRFGSPLDPGYRLTGFRGLLPEGVATLVWRPSYGLLFFWPALPLAAFGLRRFASRFPREGLLILAVAISLLVLYARWWANWGMSWGPRYLVPVLPLLSLWLLPLAAGRRGRAALAVAAAAGVCVQAVAVGTSYWHQVRAVHAQVRFDDPLAFHRDPRIAPLVVGLWWLIGRPEPLAAPPDGGALQAPWTSVFPWKDMRAASLALAPGRGLDLWAAPERWRMRYRPVWGGAPSERAIPSSPSLLVLLLGGGLSAALAFLYFARGGRRQRGIVPAALRIPARSIPLLVLLSLAARAGAASAEPLDLAGCVRRALARNATVEKAQDASRSAEVSRTVALADYEVKAIPTIQGGVRGRNRTDQRYEMLFSRKLLTSGTEVAVSGGTSVFSSVPEVSVPYFSEGRITVTQPLLQGRTRLENRDAIDDAERRIAAAEHELAQTREELALEVVRTFYDVVKAEELQAVAEKSLDRVGALRKVAEGKLELGAVSKMDVFRADLHATRLKNALVEQKARRDASLDTLKLLLDVDPRIALEIDARVQGPSADAYDAERAEEAALERRIELVEARDEVANAERKLLLARYRVWPALDLVGFYAKQGFGNDFRDSTTLDRQEWNVGLQSSVPLQRTVEQAAVAEAEIVLRGRERDYRQIRAEVVRQARDAYRQLDRARAAQVLAGDIADQASEQAELARFRYEKGVTDNFDLVQSEVQLAEARSGTAIAAIDTAIAAAELHRVAGTLAERFGTPAGAASEPLPDEDAAGEDPGEDR